MRQAELQKFGVDIEDVRVPQDALATRVQFRQCRPMNPHGRVGHRAQQQMRLRVAPIHDCDQHGDNAFLCLGAQDDVAESRTRSG